MNKTIKALLKDYKKQELEMKVDLHCKGVDEYEDKHEEFKDYWLGETPETEKLRKVLSNQLVDMVHSHNGHEVDAIDNVLFSYSEGSVSLKKASEMLSNWRFLHNNDIDTEKVIRTRGFNKYENVNQLAKLDEYRILVVESEEELRKLRGIQ